MTSRFVLRSFIILWLVASSLLLFCSGTSTASADDYLAVDCKVGDDCGNDECLKYCHKSKCSKDPCYCYTYYGHWKCAEWQ